MTYEMERERINSWREPLDDEDDDLDDEEDDDLDQDGFGYVGDSLSNTNTAFRNVSGRQPRSEESKRDHHNRLERKRRASIKTCYSSLREVIPTLRGTKASRAVILQKAVDHIDELRGIVHDVSNNIRELRRRDQSYKADLRRREVILQKRVSEYRDLKQKLQQQLQQQQLRQQQVQQQTQQDESQQQTQHIKNDDVKSPVGQSSNSQQQQSQSQASIKQKQVLQQQISQKRKLTITNHNNSAPQPKRQQNQHMSQRTQVQVLQMPGRQTDQDQELSPVSSHQSQQANNYNTKAEPHSDFEGQE